MQNPCEYIAEVAKNLVYEERFNILKYNQEYIFGEQLKNLRMVYDKVDLIITDAPLLQFLTYGPQDKEFQNFVLSRYHQFNNFEIFIKMKLSKLYQQVGRIHDEQQSLLLNDSIYEVVKNNSNFIEFDNVDNVFNLIKGKL